MSTNQPRIGAAGVPALYRHCLQIVEPLIAFGGVCQGLFAPEDYLNTMTGSMFPYDPRTRFLYTELAGGWLLIVFIDAVILRMFDDIDLWTMLCWGILLSDALFLHSCAQAVGGWSIWVNVANWGWNDWLVFLTTMPPVIARLLIVFRIGFKNNYQGGKKQ